MKMLVVGAIAAVLAVTTLDMAGGQRGDGRLREGRHGLIPKLKFQKCVEAIPNVTLDDVDEFFFSTTPGYNTQGLKCVAGCFYETQEVIAANGKLNKEELAKYMTLLKEKNGPSQPTNACDTEIESAATDKWDICDLGAAIESCLFKTH